MKLLYHLSLALYSHLHLLHLLHSMVLVVDLSVHVGGTDEGLVLIWVSQAVSTARENLISEVCAWANTSC
jgi:hypothetical protein